MKPDVATRPVTVLRKPFPWRCPECGKKEVRAAQVPYTTEVKYDGRLYMVQIPELSVPRCGACGELVFDVRADEQIARKLRNQLGLLSVDQIRINREKLRLSQRQLAERLGVAVETISRWETGALTQSRAMDRYLRVYFGVPAVRVALESNDAFSSLGAEVQS
jgi:putative zinc finger/helix-turn-helix YgiT family protein